MGKKFVSVTLDLDEETLTILERASAKRGSTLSQMAHELISKALHEIMPSREDVLRTVGETIQALSDKGHLIDQLLALTGKDAQGKRESVDNASDVTLFVMQAGTNVFGSEQGFLEWLSIPTPALEDKTPLSLLSSPAGLLKVIDVLGIIERRVPS
ncbi:MAG TPA: MbcA/ParS/Xre antitoxin family protein [Syntrophorhabdales bacterium]|nr:MbcA/ParS/Xre antitoxin family protein [Syntrophorhabdales bacterium]